MDIKKYLVVLLVFASPALAQISPRLDSMRVEVYRNLNLPSTGTFQANSDVVNARVNYAIQKVCRDFNALEKFDTLYIEKDSNGAGFPSDFIRLKSSWYVNDTVRIPLKFISVDSLWMITGAYEDNIQSMQDSKTPRYYYSWGGRFFVHPRWRRPDTALYLVHYQAYDTLLQADASETSVLPEYRGAIVDLATSRTAALLGRGQEAAYWLDLYRERKSAPVVREAEAKR